MRFANHDGRLTLLSSSVGDDLQGAPGTDVNQATGGRIPADPERAFAVWDEMLGLLGDAARPDDVTIDRHRLGSPSPTPRQIFGIGINYADHGAESGMEAPEVPLVFTKLQTAVTGPYGSIELSTRAVDWEVELAVVIGKPARRVTSGAGWEFVAGVTAGQDLSDREIQWRPAKTPQFGLGKSLPGFAPLGPVLVTPDEYDDPDDIELACHLNGEEMQRSRSSNMLLSVGELIAYLSEIAPLLPGDVIFTGTPSGIGMSRTPPRYLVAGDSLESYVEGVGTMSHTFVPVPAAQEIAS